MHKSIKFHIINLVDVPILEDFIAISLIASIRTDESPLLRNPCTPRMHAGQEGAGSDANGAAAGGRGPASKLTRAAAKEPHQITITGIALCFIWLETCGKISDAMPDRALQLACIDAPEMGHAPQGETAKSTLLQIDQDAAREKADAARGLLIQ
jgi:hypothetical protein